jgi:hypothetical protein
LDALAVASYSDAGSNGSLLAHGFVSHLRAVIPDPPQVMLYTESGESKRRIVVPGLTSWVYYLEQSLDCIQWTTVTGPLPGIGTNLTFEVDVFPANIFYRVRAERP